MPPRKPSASATPRVLGSLLPRTWRERLSESIAPPPAALRYARTHNMTRLLLSLLGTSLLCIVGIAHAVKDPQNPAAWLLLYFWTIPLMLVLYWHVYAPMVPKAKRVNRFAILALTLYWTTLTFGITTVIPQLVGLLTILFWGVFILLFWALTLVGIDYAFEGALRHLVKEHCVRTWKTYTGR